MRKSLLLLFILATVLFLISGCLNKKTNQSDQNTSQNIVSPIGPLLNPMKVLEEYWLSFAESHVGISSSTFQMPIPERPSLLGNEFLHSLLMYDPLNGSTLGFPTFPAYSDGILYQAAVFGGDKHYIRYSIGSQIPSSGVIQFFIYTPGFQPAYQFNFILNQPGFGGAAVGDIFLALWPNNVLVFGQWGPGWNYMYTSPLPLNQWVKITAVYGSLGMYLYVNDQLACSDLNRKIPLSSRPFYFGTTTFWGPETAFTGRLDEIISFSGTPEVKIIFPASGTVFEPNAEIALVGFGLNLIWTKQGIPIGTGNIVKTILPPGEHLITLSGQNAIGQPGSDNITITVALPGSLKIVQPANNSQFNFGETVTFVGEKIGEVTNIEWHSSINQVFANTLVASFSSLSPGTHTITLRGISGGGQPLSNSITIVIQPLVIEISFNPREVRPTGVPNAVPTTVTVTVTSNGQPVSNHPVNATATAVANSGGHLHDGNRPIGTFAPTTGDTLANGVFTTTYTPSQFGGTETIIIRSGLYPNVQATRDLTVRVPDLELLPETDYYVQIGGTIHHPGPPMQEVDNTNHWGRPDVNQAIQQLARDFNAMYRVRPPIADLLQFNDISLPNGGVFDINGMWATNYHADHREGINVDFNHRPLNNEQRDWLWDQITDSFDEEPHPHPRPPAETHWHLIYARPL